MQNNPNVVDYFNNNYYSKEINITYKDLSSKHISKLNEHIQLINKVSNLKNN